MIVFDLSCHAGHGFEGWFSSSDEYARQQERGLVTCPQCGSAQVAKAPMAPSLAKKGNQQRSGPAPVRPEGPSDPPISGPANSARAISAEAMPGPGSPTFAPTETRDQPGQPQPMANAPLPAEVVQALTKMAQMQREAIKNSEWVGDKFAEKSRAMHYGETDQKAIHGRASPKESQELAEEGIAVAPLLFPFAPPDEVN